MKTKQLALAAGCAIAVAALGSLAHPFGDPKAAGRGAPPFDGEPMDPAALAIVSRSCTNCHSENTEWPAYSYVAPFSWMIEKDVRDARRHMNLSRWAGYDAEQRQSMLARMGSMVRNRLMPPERYLMLHPSARLSDPEAEALYQWTRSARRRLSAADAALHSRWICAVLPLPEAGRRSHKLG